MIYHTQTRAEARGEPKENQTLVLDEELNVMVPDDILGVGVRNGVYSCLNRDYCHDRRSFQAFNSGPSLFRRLWAFCVCFTFFQISCVLTELI